MNISLSYDHTIVLAGVVFISCLLPAPEAFAHSPLIPGSNENLAAATLINDPTKSWAVYAKLHEGREVQYYRFNISRGQRIHISLIKSTNPEDMGFTPGFVLIGPGINGSGNVPDYVEIPAGAIVVTGEQPAEATYEPFSASSFYSLAELDMDAPATGTYYIAVHEPYRRGGYGLAIGDREEYTLIEWILIPVNLISIYQWEGQNIAVIFAPMGLVLAVGLIILGRRLWTAQIPFEWTGTLAGLMFVGSSAMLLFQMIIALTRTNLVPEIAITIILALVPFLLGTAVIYSITTSRGKVGIRKRAYLVILGTLALFAWAGLLIGPALAVLTSILPARTTVRAANTRI